MLIELSFNVPTTCQQHVSTTITVTAAMDRLSTRLHAPRYLFFLAVPCLVVTCPGSGWPAWIGVRCICACRGPGG